MLGVTTPLANQLLTHAVQVALGRICRCADNRDRCRRDAVADGEARALARSDLHAAADHAAGKRLRALREVGRANAKPNGYASSRRIS